MKQRRQFMDKFRKKPRQIGQEQNKSWEKVLQKEENLQAKRGGMLMKIQREVKSTLQSLRFKKGQIRKSWGEK